VREKLEPTYFYLRPDQLRKKVDQRKRDSLKSVVKQTDYDRSLTKSFEAEKKEIKERCCITRTTITTINPPLSFLTSMVQTWTY
jgi:hypothetical protein